MQTDGQSKAQVYFRFKIEFAEEFVQQWSDFREHVEEAEEAERELQKTEEGQPVAKKAKKATGAQTLTPKAKVAAGKKSGVATPTVKVTATGGSGGSGGTGGVITVMAMKPLAMKTSQPCGRKRVRCEHT